VLAELRSSPIVGQFGLRPTISFFWEGMKNDVHIFADECESCKRKKGGIVKSPKVLWKLLILPTILASLYGFYRGPP
jgi:hypothetical protein